LFFDQLSDNYTWDFVCLQEAFTHSADIEFEGGHLIYPSSEVGSGLRCPAVLVHKRWSSSSRIAGSGVRWVCVEIEGHFDIVSLHLPHSGIHISEFITCLEELRGFLNLRRRLVFLGVDANTELGCVSDFVHVGPGIPQRDTNTLEADRASLFHDFLVEAGIYVANTFTDLAFTRYNWSGTGAGRQIDFLGLPLRCPCIDSGVDESMHLASDHRYL